MKYEYSAEGRPRFGVSLGLFVDCLNTFSVPGNACSILITNNVLEIKKWALVFGVIYFRSTCYVALLGDRYPLPILVFQHEGTQVQIAFSNGFFAGEETTQIPSTELNTMADIEARKRNLQTKVPAKKKQEEASEFALPNSPLTKLKLKAPWKEHQTTPQVLYRRSA